MPIFTVNLKTGEVRARRLEDAVPLLVSALIGQYVRGDFPNYFQLIDAIVEIDQAAHVAGALLAQIRHAGYNNVTFATPASDDSLTEFEQKIGNVSKRYVNALIRGDTQTSDIHFAKATELIQNSDSEDESYNRESAYFGSIINNMVTVYVYGVGAGDQPPPGLDRKAWEVIKTRIVPQIRSQFT